MTDNLKWAAAALLMSCLMGLAQNPQGHTKVYGRVIDPNEARVGGASVTLKNLSTQQRVRTKTTEVGEFVFDGIQPGRYELTATFLGAETHKEQLLIRPGEEKGIHITLGVHRCPDPVKRLSGEEKRKTPYCSIHGEKLRLDVVPIEYGLVMKADDASAEYPNAHWIYYGGCVADCYKKAEVRYCSECRKADLERRGKRGESIGQGLPNQVLPRRLRSRLLILSPLPFNSSRFLASVLAPDFG